MSSNSTVTDMEENVVDADSAGSLCTACHATYRVIMAIVVRGLLLVHALLAVWLLVSLKQNDLLWSLTAINFLLVLELMYTVVKRRGRESKWFCPCFLAYLAAVLPPIWFIELDRFGRFQDALGKSPNLTSTSLTEVNGLTVPIKLEPEIWVSAMEQTLLFMLVMCRWLLPRGDISRHELSQLLFVFLGIASDNMGLFELFDETEVRSDPVLTYVIMGVWTFSFVQFLFVLTATKSPQEVSVVHNIQTDRKRRVKHRPGPLEVIFTTEIWSLVFSVLTQDGPYAAVRIYTVIKHKLITYSIIFFICKNLLVICLVFYRLIVICLHMAQDDDDDDNSSVYSKRSTSEKEQ